MEDLDKQGLMTTPVTFVDGAPIVGYDVPLLRAALSLPRP
jgi:hypothetical protein